MSCTTLCAVSARVSCRDGKEDSDECHAVGRSREAAGLPQGRDQPPEHWRAVPQRGRSQVPGPRALARGTFAVLRAAYRVVCRARVAVSRHPEHAPSCRKRYGQSSSGKKYSLACRSTSSTRDTATRPSSSGARSCRWCILLFYYFIYLLKK